MQVRRLWQKLRLPNTHRQNICAVTIGLSDSGLLDNGWASRLQVNQASIARIKMQPVVPNEHLKGLSPLGPGAIRMLHLSPKRAK